MSDPVQQYLREGEINGSRYRLTAPGRASLGTAGHRLARSPGESMDFMEHRDYQPGDDLRRMNWSAYARSNRLVVKIFRQEVCPHFDLVIDGSCSMALPGTDKLQATVGLSAAMAAAADNSGYSRRVYLTAQGCQQVRGGIDRPSTWQAMSFNSRRSPSESFQIHPPVWRPHGIRAMISDFLWLGNPLDILNPMSHQAASILLIQILATDDANPSQLGNQRLVDSESGQTLELSLDSAGIQRYRENLNRHQQAWHQAARQVGARFFTFIAEDLCKSWDLSPLVLAEALVVN